MEIDRERKLRQRLHQLREEHQELDEHIGRIGAEPAANLLELTRLKRRKLQLKDAIIRIESQLIPNLNA